MRGTRPKCAPDGVAGAERPAIIAKTNTNAPGVEKRNHGIESTMFDGCPFGVRPSRKRPCTQDNFFRRAYYREFELLHFVVMFEISHEGKVRSVAFPLIKLSRNKYLYVFMPVSPKKQSHEQSQSRQVTLQLDVMI